MINRERFDQSRLKNAEDEDQELSFELSALIYHVRGMEEDDEKGENDSVTE